MVKKMLGFTIFLALSLTCVVLFRMNQVSQRALECSTYVHTGTDLTGKGENNCTNPELIP